MTNQELHEEADELARAIERQIQANNLRLAEAPDFPVGRRAREQSTVPSLEQLVESRT